MQKLVKTQKSTNNLMSIFGMIEENMKLSHIHLAVLEQQKVKVYDLITLKGLTLFSPGGGQKA